MDLGHIGRMVGADPSVGWERAPYDAAMASANGSLSATGGVVGPPRVVDLGRMPYETAYAEQCRHLDEVLAARESGRREAGRILLVEHDPPVITVSKRPGSRANLVASESRLRELGVTVAETDRGG